MSLGQTNVPSRMSLEGGSQKPADGGWLRLPAVITALPHQLGPARRRRAQTGQPVTD